MKRRKVKVVSLFLILYIFIVIISYTSTYLKYNDYSIVKYNSLEIENNKLREDIKELSSIKYDKSNVVKVINRNIYNFYDEVTVYGDIKVNDAIVNNDGLVGVVYKVKKKKGYVKLLTSKYNISVKVGKTYGNLNNGVITLLDKDSKIKVGDKVYTSGLDNISSNIYVGVVSKICNDHDNLGKKVYVKLIDNKNLNYVGVISK